jgi:hypothetical protein
MNVLQRELWDGQPSKLGEMFVLKKGDRAAECQLWSHWSGWELRLEIRGEMVRTLACRSQEEVFSTAETWKAAMREKGWA